jgi:hypothetical protein
VQKESRPKQSQLCPCGSGKKYKQCCAVKKERRRRALRRFKSILMWIGVAAGLALLIYGVSQMSGVAYSDAELGVVNFSALNQTQKRAALRAANQARCPCGCGMTLAQCVATDSTCPLRTKNIDRIKAMVEENGKPRSSS